ncbi:MAG TPA: HK97 family phage prohead protease [Planctomycetota bacterium]|nr:HK97 family phage prohead protease [Planctomycetota bacterium]
MTTNTRHSAAEQSVVQELAYRHRGIKRARVDAEARTVAVTFSSETRSVSCWDWELGEVPEILSHEPGACNLLPFITAGSVLRNHNHEVPVAIPESVSIDEDRRGRAVIRFPEGDEDAEEAWTKVQKRLIRGVSAGYSVQAATRVREGEALHGHEGPCVVATEWTLHEISLTPVPADPSVGVERSRSIYTRDAEQFQRATVQPKMSPRALRRKLRQREALRREKEVEQLCAIYETPRDLRDFLLNERFCRSSGLAARVIRTAVHPIPNSWRFVVCFCEETPFALGTRGEIIICDGSANLEPLLQGNKLLYEHNEKYPLGRIRDAWFEPRRRRYCAEIELTEIGLEIRAQVRDEIWSGKAGISPCFIPRGRRRLNEGEYWRHVSRPRILTEVKEFEEISITNDPANGRLGVLYHV